MIRSNDIPESVGRRAVLVPASNVPRELLKPHAVKLVKRKRTKKLDPPLKQQRRVSEFFEDFRVSSNRQSRVRHAPVSYDGLARPNWARLARLVANRNDKIKVV